MLRNLVAAMTLGLASASTLYAAPAQDCKAVGCSAGDKAITYATKADPFMTCPSKGLDDYMTFELGMLQMVKTFTGKMPNISDKTGDIDYEDGPDGPNKSRLIQDYFREKAGVATFDQALAMCSRGKGGHPVTILNWPSPDVPGFSAWVHDEKTDASYWMPEISLNKR